MPLISHGTWMDMRLKTSQCFLPSSSLDELVKDGQNGLIFQNASQLAEQFEVCPLT